jgi:hypothetical protein
MGTEINLNKEALKQAVKQQFKQLNFKKGIEILLENINDDKSKQDIADTLNTLQKLIDGIPTATIPIDKADDKQQLVDSADTSYNEKFYYKLNKIIVNTLKILDEITADKNSPSDIFDENFSWDEIMTFKNRHIRNFFDQKIQKLDYIKAAEILLFNADKTTQKDTIKKIINQFLEHKENFQKNADIDNFYFATNKTLADLLEIAAKITNIETSNALYLSEQTKENFKNKIVRQIVKEKLKNREYQQALNFLSKVSDNQQVKDDIAKIINDIKTIKNQLEKKEINADKYYYAINKSVINTLDILDKVTGSSEEDLEFWDELSSSLKFNLVDSDEILNSKRPKSGIHKIKAQLDPMQNKFTPKQAKKRIEKLYQQLSIYEQKEQKENNPEQKAKINEIIQAIYYEIEQEEKKD